MFDERRVNISTKPGSFKVFTQFGDKPRNRSKTAREFNTTKFVYYVDHIILREFRIVSMDYFKKFTNLFIGRGQNCLERRGIQQ